MWNQLTDAAAEEGEEERRVARNLGRDLELEEGHGQTEDDDVDADNERLAAGSKGGYVSRQFFQRL